MAEQGPWAQYQQPTTSAPQSAGAGPWQQYSQPAEESVPESQYFAKGIVESVKEPGRAVKGVVAEGKKQFKAAKETLTEMLTGKNDRMQKNFVDYQQGKISHADYAKIVDEYDTPLFDLGAFAIQTYAWTAKAVPLIAGLRKAAGTAMLGYGAGSAQTPEEMGAITLNTAEMMAAWTLAGKSMQKTGEIASVLKQGTLKAIKQPVTNGTTPLADKTPMAKIEIDVNNPKTQAMIMLENKFGTASRETSKLASLLHNSQRKLVQEQQGINSLDEMISNGISPRKELHTFANSTYDRLSPTAKVKFQQQVKAVTGFKPGDTIAKGDTLKDWKDVIRRGLDLGDDPEMLTGTERGIATLIYEGNKRVGQPISNQITTGKLTIETPATKLDVPALKARIMQNLDYKRANTPAELSSQLTKIAKKSGQQLELFKDNDLDNISTAAAQKLWADPEFQTIRNLYQPNAAKKLYTTHEAIDVKKSIGSGKGLQTAKGVVALEISNAHTIATSIGLKPQVTKLVQIDADATNIYHTGMNTYMKPIDSVRGNNFNLKQPGDPTGKTMGERIGIWLYGQDPSTKSILRAKTGYGKELDAYFDAKGNVKNFLTPVEQQQADVILRAGSEMYPRTAAAHKAMTGDDLPQIKNYFTRQYKRNSNLPASSEEFTMRKLTDALLNQDSLTEGIQKNRKAFAAGQLNLNAYEVFENFLRQSSRVIALGENDAPSIIRQVNNIKPHLKANYGDGVADAWLKINKNFLVGDQSSRGAPEKALGYLSGSSMSAIISGNAPKIAATQPAGIFPAADRIGYPAVTKGLARALTPEGQKLLSQDGVYTGRMGDDLVNSILRREGMGRGVYDLPKRAVLGYLDLKTMIVKKTDQLFAGAAYLGAYDQHLAKMPGDTAGALARAREVLWTTQGSAKAPYRNLMTMEGAGGKLVSPFTVAPSAQFNNIMEASIAHSNGTVSSARLVGTYMNNMILPAIYTGMVDLGAMALGAAGKGEDFELKSEEITNGVALSLAQQLPIVGSWSMAVRMTGNKLSFPFTRPIELAIRGGTEIQQGLSKEDTAKVIDGAMNSLEAYSTLHFGLGLKIERDIAKKYIHDMLY